MLNFCDFIQVFIFTTNHHLNIQYYLFFSFYVSFLCFSQSVEILDAAVGTLDRLHGHAD